MKTYMDMADADTLMEVSLVNPHVSEVTPQVLGIPTNVLSVRDHHLFYKNKLQLLNVQEVQPLECRVWKFKLRKFKF
jgi:hypothetical protein